MPFIWEVEARPPEGNCQTDLDFSNTDVWQNDGSVRLPIEDTDLEELTVLLSPERLKAPQLQPFFHSAAAFAANSR